MIQLGFVKGYLMIRMGDGMNVLSLFDGISCGMIALEKAKLKVDSYIAFENDPIPVQVSKNHYPNIQHFGDVFEGDYTKYKGFDLLIGGSPCTFWSINKKDRETTSDGIGYKLFLQFVRALEESKSRYFLYENNYKIHKDIQNEITKALKVEPILINSSLLSAQKRERLYWTNIPNVTQPENKKVYVKNIIEYGAETKENLFDITKFKVDYNKGYSDSLIRIGTIGKGGQGERVYSINGKTANLTANGGGRGAKTGLYEIGGVVRKLTPIEAERAQTLPDDYTKGLSNTNRYKCVGNGWTVDVIAHILKGLK